MNAISQSASQTALFTKESLGQGYFFNKLLRMFIYAGIFIDNQGGFVV